jgi:cytochrome c oxidase subunit 4
MGDGHNSHHANYFAIFIALCICTVLSVLFDVVRPDYKVLVVLVLSVATAKALFVMTYFMHLKFEGNWKFVLLAPTVILAMGLPLALLPDVGQHYYFNVAPQSLHMPKVHGEEGGHGSPDTEHSEAPTEHAE